MNIAVVGTGYVGLVTGVCFAEMGNYVSCVDIDEEKVKKLQSGIAPIYEHRLDELLKNNIEEGRIKFTSSLISGIKGADVIFLALPTPPAEDGTADLKYVLGVAKEIGQSLDHYAVVVNKSTVPVGTFEKVKSIIRKSGNKNFDVVSNPEFLREGLAISDFMSPDRIILGVENTKSQKILEELYAPLSSKGSKIFVMDMKSAEITKYAANAFLATKISFMNEIANICEKVGADVDQVRLGVGSDKRIGDKFLFPGIGYGGSCFPKDVQALRKTAEEYLYDFNILNAVTEVNVIQKQKIINSVRERFGTLEGRKFALWGIAFKPETDDIREAPALEIITSLLRAGAEVCAYDPKAINNAKQIFQDEDNLSFADDQYGTLEEADALIIATEWNLFKNSDFEKMKRLMKHSVIFDGRNVFDVEFMKNTGFDYISIGRERVEA